MEKGAESSPGSGVFQAGEGPGGDAAVALFGGAFDPPHNGHLAVAECVLASLPVTEVAFLVAGSPPHKRRSATPRTIRLAMTRALVSDRPRMRVEEAEVERSGPTFLVDTLEELRARRRGRIYFVLGMDALRTMHHWHRVEDVFRLCIPVAVTRPGSDAEIHGRDLPFLAEGALRDMNRRTLRLASDVSSSLVRDRIGDAGGAAGAATLVPAAVLEIIESEGLYRDGGTGHPHQKA